MHAAPNDRQPTHLQRLTRPRRRAKPSKIRDVNFTPMADPSYPGVLTRRRLALDYIADNLLDEADNGTPQIPEAGAVVCSFA